MKMHLMSCGLVLLPVAVFAGEITVSEGDDLFARVAEANALVAAGDKSVTVKVGEGTYEIADEIAVTNGISIVATGSREKTTVRQTSVDRRAFAIKDGKVSGFTITGVDVESKNIVSGVGGNGYGWAVYAETSKAMLTNCVVTGNVSKQNYPTNPSLHGGTVGLYNGSIVTDCVIANNTSGSPGAGVFMYRGNVIGCIITNNVNQSEQGAGISIWQGGTIRNSLVAYNSAKNGGGIMFNQVNATLTIQDCTIVGNRCDVNEKYAAGFYYSGDKNYLTLTGNLFADNLDANGNPSDVSYANEHILYKNCCFPTDAEGRVTMRADSANNIYADPLFMEGDLCRLSGASPCIDVGDSSPVDAKDVGGRPRVTDGKGDGVAVCDIGCWEYQRGVDEPYVTFEVTAGALQVAGAATASFVAEAVFDGQVVTEGVSYTWDFGDGSNPVTVTGDPSVSHVYSTAGKFAVSVSVAKGGASAGKTLPGAVKAYPAVAQPTVYVSKSGSGAFPYATEATATRSPQEALQTVNDMVVLGQAPADIEVGDGEYEVDGEMIIGNGMEVRSVHGPQATILRQTAANRRVFAVNNGVVSGFTITGCSASNGRVESSFSSLDGGYGFAVVLYSSKSTLTNCTVTGNAATGTYVMSNPSLHGGTVCVYDFANLRRCVIANNTTDAPGAGVFTMKGVIEGCVITNNANANSGGGIRVWIGVEEISNCLIAGNRAKIGAGIFFNQEGYTLPVGHCTIVGNRTPEDGGAAGYSYEGTHDYATFTGCIFSDNLNDAGAESEVHSTNACTAYKQCCFPATQEGRIPMQAASAGNIWNDPGFSRQPDCPWRPSADSPCRNVVPAVNKDGFDLSGILRRRGRKSDIGCYECCPAGLMLIFR